MRLASSFGLCYLELKIIIMIDLLFEGGILFMSILTITLTANVGVVVYCILTKNRNENQLGLVKSIGLFALVFGLLGQFIGLYDALEAISIAGDIPPSLLAAGIRVSSITSIYGMIIFILSYLMWFGLRLIPKNSV